jgi:hypothetical protein
MKLDPGFLNHWKTDRLMEQLGADGVVAVLRLWGAAQIRRKYDGLELTPKRLALETKWRGDHDRLFAVLTDPDAPWLDPEPEGTFTIHGFAEHQHQVVKLWEHGKMGGRPKKVSPTPPSKEEDSSSSTSSSSYPICEPYGNQMVSEAPPTKGKFHKPTAVEVEEYGKTLTPPFADAERFTDFYSSKGWKVGTSAMKDWKASVRNWHRKAQEPPASSGKSKFAGIQEDIPLI